MLQAGGVTIHFLNAGFWYDDGGAQFGIVPRELWSREKSPNARNRIKMSLTCPLIVCGQDVILVDTGIGNRLSEREVRIYTPDPADRLVNGLDALGLTPQDVTHVVLSHLHFDHVGGLIDKTAEKLFPTWRQNFEEWKKVGSDRPYHYLGSAIWYTRIGHGMGESMLELLKNKKN